MTKIAIGSDHGGFEYKSKIIDYLKSHNFEYEDMGTYDTNSCDYPIIAKKVAQKVVDGDADKGILICGTGIGMSIAANKVKGIRAALCSDTFSARATRAHNNSNILCLGERITGTGLALDIVEIWLNTDFQGGRHEIRINKFWEICAVIVEVIALFLMYKYVNDFASVYGVGGSFSEKLSFYDTITKFNSEYKLRMPWYVSIANLIGRSCCYIALYVIVRNYVSLKRMNIKLLVAVIVYFISSLMGGRTEAFRIVTAAIFLWYYFYKRKNGWRKGSIKIAIRMVVIIILIVVGFSLLRGVLGRTTYDPVKVVFGYIGAPLKNLDTFLSNPKKSISGIWGAMTFTKFINWLGIKFHIQPWIYVSDQPFLYFKEFRMGNVYTTYYNFYYDFGFWGCIVLISIIAVYYCYAYRKLKAKTNKKKVVDFQLIIYAYLFKDLIMLPFSSRFYETIVNINFIRIMIILGALTWLINNLSIKSGKIYINLQKLKRRRKIGTYVR